MKQQGYYCKVCGKYKANEKFSGKGRVNHICKACASLSAEKKAERGTINRILDLPLRLNAEQREWLRNRTEDERPAVRELALEEYRMRFDYDMDINLEEFEAIDAEMEEEYDFQRHLTPEIFAQINPNHKLLDFEIFQKANAGDSAAIEAVMEYHKDDLEGYMSPDPDEFDLRFQQRLVRAFRVAIYRYKIGPDDTYYCYDELLDLAHEILDAEEAAEMALYSDPVSMFF